jgi:hypothetical protein
MEILPFEPEFEQEVVDLIVGIQRGEFAIPISAEAQPDLQRIPEYYQSGPGNFWVALPASFPVMEVDVKFYTRRLS